MWKDTSSFSRDDKKRIPNDFTLQGFPRTMVHRHIHYEPDAWLLSSFNLGIDKHVLKAKDLQVALKEAEHVIRTKLEKSLKLFEEAVTE